MKKVVLFLLLIVFTKPSYAQASFFSSIKNLFIGNDAKAEEIPDDSKKIVHNSQTMQLLESTPALNPDMKKVSEKPFEIASDEALVVAPVPLGEDYDLEANASDEKIDIYVVKNGDTLKSIAKKLKIDEKALIASNSDLKKEDMIKTGQALVILPTKDTSKEEEKKKQEQKLAKEKEEKAKEAKELALKKKQESDKKKLALDLSKKESVKEIVPVTPENTLKEVVDVVEKEIESVIEDKKEDTSDKQSGVLKGGYIWPFPKGVGVITQGLHDDQAYDFGAPKGTPIYAIADGTVFIARPTGYNGGYGLYVVINFDDGRQAIFGHMSKVVAEAGDVVKRGDIIGYVGSTGKSTGPHVHIGFRGSLKNPYLSLKKGANSFSF